MDEELIETFIEKFEDYNNGLIVNFIMLSIILFVITLFFVMFFLSLHD